MPTTNRRSSRTIATGIGLLTLLASLAAAAPASAKAPSRQVTASIMAVDVGKDGDAIGCGEFRVRPWLYSDGVAQDEGTTHFGNYFGAFEFDPYGIPVDEGGNAYDTSDLCTGQHRFFPLGILLLSGHLEAGSEVQYGVQTIEADVGHKDYSYKHCIMLPTNLGTSIQTITEKGGSGKRAFAVTYTVKVTVTNA